MATTNKAKLPLGFVIAGKYRITGELGRGGMAAVYEAENIDIGKRVAIKVLAQELISSTVVVERFLREARAVAAIRSPYICDVYDSGRLEDGRPFLVLELLEGESLYDQMIRVGQIDVSTTVTIINQTCKGLVKAHSAGIVHRDLKPENIFVTKDEEGRILAKILDFGLAKFYSPMETNPGQARLTREGAVFGTPAYMSPEQVRGQGAVDSRADLWALACITYESLTGRTVWNTEQGVAMTFAQIASAPLPDAYTLRPDLPEGFRAWFTRALDRSIDKRFQTPKEFSEELLRAMSMAQLSNVETDDDGLPTSGGRVQSLPAAGGAAPAANPIPLKLDTPFESNADVAARGSKSKFVAPSPSDGETRSGDANAKPAPSGSGAGRIVVAIAAVGILAGGGYAAYRAVAPPTSSTGVTSNTAPPPGSVVPTASGSASAEPSSKPIELPPMQRATVPYAAQISKAQEAIAARDYATAEKLLKEAGPAPFPKTMLQDLRTGEPGSTPGKCALTGLGRPRTYDLFQDRPVPKSATQAVIVNGTSGIRVAWTENGNDGTQRAYAVPLDDALRPTSDAVLLTPEGQVVLEIDLKAHGDDYVLSYWESAVTDLNVYARVIHADGLMDNRRVVAKLTQSVKVNPWPQIVDVPGKGLAVAYVANIDKTDDLFMQFTKDDLTPVGDPLRITSIQPARGPKAHIAAFAGGVSTDSLHFVVRIDRDNDRAFKHVRIPLTGPWKSVAATPDASGPDASVGTITALGKDKVDEVGLACGGVGCFTAFARTDTQGGINAGFLTNTGDDWGWQNPVSRTGRHPEVAVDDGGAQLVWLEGTRVLTTRVTAVPHGNAEVMPVASINSAAMNSTSLMVTPSIARGSKPNEWLVSWIDIEGNATNPPRGEVYVARVECK